MKFKQSCYFCLLLFSFGSCAIQVPPDGGNKDLEPPHIISSSPSNYSTSFKGHYIRLDFDEFISLNEISSQLIVSPLLNYPVETKIRKKSLFIHIQDTLLENSTYTMNFGQGITDYNEGNKLDNFQFVFSTGTVIDSLEIGGKVEAAFDHKSSKGILALLYRGNSDSLPYIERPLYFAQTNDSGLFKIRNISPGYYKLIALKDKDGNYLYLKGEELIGSPDTLIKAGTENIDLKIFSEIPKIRFLRAYSEFPGKAVIVFNASADTIKWQWLTDTTKLKIYSLNYSKEHDTINIWYKNITADSISFRFDNYSMSDTVTIRLFKNTEGNFGRKKVGFSINPGTSQTIRQHLHLPFYLQSNHPISTTEFNKIILLEDSIPVKPEFIFMDSLHLQLQTEFKWKSKGSYSLFIPPGTFTDIYGTKNDTLQFIFTAHEETDYGSIKLFLKKTDDMPYIVQLIDDGGMYIYREFKCNHDTTVLLSNIDPGIYKVKLIRDRNGNGKWDTGNYLDHIQPEEIEFYHEGITVRANWDVDVYIKAPLSTDK